MATKTHTPLSGIHSVAMDASEPSTASLSCRCNMGYVSFPEATTSGLRRRTRSCRAGCKVASNASPG
jgi:hypothetical protein